ncbi:hypothetical protein [Granulicella sp. S190]|nr:hypothetical protein [Granulicella sp. S190]
MDSLTSAAVEIEKWPLHIVDASGISIEKEDCRGVTVSYQAMA